MLQIVESVLFFVSDLERSTAFYRTVLGEEPEVRLEDRLVSFALGGQANFTLLKSDDTVAPRSAALLCDNLDPILAEWQEYAGLIDLVCLDRKWPTRFVVIRDPDHNCLIILEAGSD